MLWNGCSLKLNKLNWFLAFVSRTMHWVTLPNRLISRLSFKLTFTDKLKLVKKWEWKWHRNDLLKSCSPLDMFSYDFKESETKFETHVGPEIWLNVIWDMWTCVILNKLFFKLIQFVQYIDFTLTKWHICGDLYYAMNCN